MRLIISDGEETIDSVFTDLITVQETDQIEGTVLGVWRPEFNPYVIIDDVSIPYYDELIIEAGTEIMIEYENRMNVYGRIEIAGTESEPVILTSESSWKGIKLLNSFVDN